MTDVDKKELLKNFVICTGAITSFIWLPLVIIGIIMCSPLLLLFFLLEDNMLEDESEKIEKV